MNAHTPGPWEARFDEWSGWCVHAPTIEAETGLAYQVIQGVGGDKRTPPKHGTPEDNARLIAAAPELLSVLLDVLPELESVGPLKKFGRARAVIAKATGSQP